MARTAAACRLLLVLASACTGPNPAWRDESATDATSGDQSYPIDLGPGSDVGPIEMPPITGPDAGPDIEPEVASAPDAEVEVPDAVPDAVPPSQEAGRDTGPDAAGAPDVTVKMEVAPEAAIEVAPPKPPQIVLTGAVQTQRRGGNGGNSYVDECGSNYAVVGFAGAIEDPTDRDLIGSVQTLCGELRVASPAAGTTVTIGEMKSLNRRGNNRSISWTLRCPDDQVVVAYDGRSGNYLDRLRFRCARLALSADAKSVAIDNDTTATSSAGGQGGDSFADACPSRQIAHGAHIRAGDFVDAFSLICATPTLVP